MGWTYTRRFKDGKSLTEFFIEEGVLKWPDRTETHRILDSALVNLTEYYAAVEVTQHDTGKREVWCAVFMVRMLRDSVEHNFGWKDMCDSMGPGIANCPERILRLLTPTDNESANQWRARCRENIAKRKQKPKLVPGLVLQANPPIEFRDGSTLAKLVVRSRRGSRFVFTSPSGYGAYILSTQWINRAVASNRISFSEVPA